MSFVLGENFKNKAFGTFGVQRFERALEQSGSTRGFIRQVRKRSNNQQVQRSIADIANLYKQERELIDSPKEAIAKYNAVFDSAMIAVGALLACANKRQQDIILCVGLPVDEFIANDCNNSTETARHQIVDYGREGFEQAAVYRSTFERLETAVSPDVANRGLAIIGFGIPFCMLSQTIVLEEQHFRSQSQHHSIGADLDRIRTLSDDEFNTEISQFFEQ